MPDAKSRAAGLAPRPILKSGRDAGLLILDSETTLAGVPPEAWDYRLGNRTALDWVLDQHKEKTPKDPTIRARFNTYRFADHKQRVADLLARVTRVSVETVAIVGAMRRRHHRPRRVNDLILTKLVSIRFSYALHMGSISPGIALTFCFVKVFRSPLRHQHLALTDVVGLADRAVQNQRTILKEGLWCEPLPHCRDQGLRTPNLALSFKALGQTGSKM